MDGGVDEADEVDVMLMAEIVCCLLACSMTKHDIINRRHNHNTLIREPTLY